MADPATVVLVHGAWHGPWCWDRVTPLLDERGIRWTALDLPTCNAQPNGAATLQDDAAAVRAAIDAVGGPCVVVGHSYGGLVITEACAGHPAVKRLVYLTAFMAAAGDDLLKVFTSGEPNLALINAIENDDAGWSSLGPETVRDLFFNDCDAETVAWAVANCRAMRGGGEPLTVTAWRDIPSTFVVCEQDLAILPPLQRAMSAHATDVVTLDASHSPFASQPSAVADLLERLAVA